MASITASVGRGGVNRDADVRTIQRLLNNHVNPKLVVDGDVGPKTIAAIEDFQRRVVKLANPDGRVDPNGRTLRALTGGGSTTPTSPPPPPSSGGSGLPNTSGLRGLTEADFVRAAQELGCEVAAIKAVAEVESRGDGFFPSGRPKILFEAHVFSRLTNRAYDTSHPHISSRSWNRALYKGGEAEYPRLEEAMGLNETAALKSASWGRFQIMGFNHQMVGYSTVQAFVQAMYASEGKHLDAFVAFVKAAGLTSAIREKRWADFAYRYNGEGYKANRYDEKMAEAYRRYSRGG